jgi:HK97 family phage prohead protease
MSQRSSAAIPRLETKFMPLAGAQAREDGRIEGHASLFDVPDASGDEVAPGAFAATLARPALRPKLLWQHDPAQPIGVWDVLREDERGLWAEGRLIGEVRAGAEALALLRAGAVDGLSIGFRTVRAARLPDGRRRLIEVELWEISLVTFPMLDEARAAAGPAADDDAEPELRRLAETLEQARRLFV